MNKNIKYYNENAKQLSEKWNQADMSSFCDRFVELLKGKNILELGCGSGRDAKFFTEKGLKVLATDGSINLLKVAKENAPKAEFQELDFSKPFNLKIIFDGIWACSSLVHFSEDELEQVIQSIKLHMDEESLLFLTLKICDFKVDENRTFNYWSNSKAKNFFIKNGLQIIEEEINSTEYSKWLSYYAKLNLME